MNNYKAYYVEQTGEKQFSGSVKKLSIGDLPPGDVLINVQYSSLNYKDALSASGKPGVTRKYPHTPGIDAAGIVKESSDSRFTPGDPVIVTSYDLGMNTPGGFGQYIRVPAGWVVGLPLNMSLKESMMIGTAGFTAGMAVDEILKVVGPGDGDILVTGASGGVGSFAVMLLSLQGFDVVALSGKQSARDYLTDLGARTILTRGEAIENKDRPLLKPRWAGVVDTVGGEILANAIKATQPGGIIAACGNVASPDLHINVFPFILRGVSLTGIDSQNCPMNHRKNIWNKLANEWKPKNLSLITTEMSLDALPGKIEAILSGQITGRVLVNLED
jgi:acrylyl-CoA reductase (NADPH)